MRILVCNWKDGAHPQAGGAEVWTHGVARRWVDVGHEVVLASSAVPGRPASEDVDGVRVERGGDHRMGVFAHARRLYAAEGGRFDLVVDEINTRPFNAPSWAERSEVVAVLHQVAREVWFAESPLPVAVAGRFLAEPVWLRRYRDVHPFTVSPSAARSLRRYGLRQVEVLPQGSTLPDSPRAASSKTEAPSFVFLGRLSASKRPQQVIRSFRLAQPRLPEGSTLTLIGGGPLEGRVRALAGDGVVVTGRLPRRHTNELLASAHALLMTSVREGWGLVVSEAAAVGTRTIAYAVPGLVDSVPACGGTLVEPNPASMAAAMVALAPWLATSPPPSSHGTVGWDVVADHLLARAVAGAPALRTAEVAA
jgi:glycosyltransferase involved in cell wall biosynthesis